MPFEIAAGINAKQRGAAGGTEFHLHRDKRSGLILAESVRHFAAGQLLNHGAGAIEAPTAPALVDSALKAERGLGGKAETP